MNLTEVWQQGHHSRIVSLSKDMRFEELKKVLERYGYVMNAPKSGSIHYIFRPPGKNPITIPKHEPIKKVFANCEYLEEMLIPSGVKEIREAAFSECKNLETISFEEGVERIGNKAFEACGKISNIQLLDSLIEIGDEVLLIQI